MLNLSEFHIGFEQTSYTVNEMIGMLEVCVRMFEPSEETPIGSVQISIGVETVQGSAGIVCRDYTLILHYCPLPSVWFTDGNDYTEETGPGTALLLFFTDGRRRSCIRVEIEDDDCYEFEEQFSLQFIALDDLPSNLTQFPNVSTITILDNEGKLIGEVILVLIALR